MTNQPTELYPPVDAAAPVRERRSVPPWLLGAIGVLLAVAAAALQIAGIVQASNLNWERGTLLAWLAIAVSIVAFVVGLIALVTNRGRRPGAVALVVAIVANPFVLTQLLNALS